MIKTICLIIVLILWLLYAFILGYSAGLKKGWKDTVKTFTEILKEVKSNDKD